MYSQRFGIVQREVKGPTPKVVIVVSTGCVCGTLLLSAFPSTSGLAEPNLAQAVALSRGVGVLCSGLDFERRSEKAIHLVPVLCSLTPHLAPVIFRFCICRITTWDTESFSLQDSQEVCPLVMWHGCYKKSAGPRQGRISGLGYW